MMITFPNLLFLTSLLSSSLLSSQSFIGKQFSCSSFCLWNPGSWGFGIRNSGQGIRNPANDRDPEFKFHKQGI